MKKMILKFTAEQIRKTAVIAAGVTSFWGAYQPVEPKMLNEKK